MYNPDSRPDGENWLSLDEGERIAESIRYHDSSAEQPPESGWEIHAVLHCIVENQIALDVGNVLITEERLVRQGLTRHDAIHAIGAVLGPDIFDAIKNNTRFDAMRYRSRLDKLTAKRWRKGKYNF